jgi:hypothetical protein
MLGGYADRDQGGFVASEIIRNLNLCIAEKAAKIAPYRERYREWWLVLPDHIGPDLDADERQTIGEHVNLLTFSRVVLIHPRAPTKALVISRSNPGSHPPPTKSDPTPIGAGPAISERQLEVRCSR